MQLKRYYELTINFGKKSRILRFKQATAYETLKFLEQVKDDDFNAVLWCFDFLNNECIAQNKFPFVKNVSKREFMKYLPEFEKIFSIILDKRFKWSFESEQKQDEEQEDEMPFNAYLVLLSEKLNVDPLTLLKNYTFEQIGELSKGMVYVLNMQTEEWRAKNKRQAIAEKMKKVDKEKLNEAFNKLISYHKK